MPGPQPVANTAAVRSNSLRMKSLAIIRSIFDFCKPREAPLRMNPQRDLILNFLLAQSKRPAQTAISLNSNQSNPISSQAYPD